MSAERPSTTGWHVAASDLADYRDGRVHGVSADSIEAHLLRCDSCRQTLASSGDARQVAQRDTRWQAITDVIDQPSRWHRSSSWVRLALGTPQLAIAALVLAVLFLAAPVLASVGDTRAAVTWFVALAPALPVAGALLAYGVAADPAGALVGATPMHSFRVVVIRTTVLLGLLLPAGVLASLLMPVRASLLLGWFLPALSFCAVVLAVGARRDPRPVAAVLAVGWAVTVVAGLSRLRRIPITDALEQASVNRPAVQIGATIVMFVALGVFTAHRDDVTYRSAA